MVSSEYKRPDCGVVATGGLLWPLNFNGILRAAGIARIMQTGWFKEVKAYVSGTRIPAVRNKRALGEPGLFPLERRLTGIALAEQITDQYAPP
jgi:hypothetical protein